jgi:DNA-directed RNA polymerase subunit RPC12/RpoP
VTKPTFVCQGCGAEQEHRVIRCEQCNKSLVFAAPTFVCKDCGADVYDALGLVRERCHPCQWVAALPDPVERAEVRQWLIEVGAIDAEPQG